MTQEVVRGPWLVLVRPGLEIRLLTGAVPVEDADSPIDVEVVLHGTTYVGTFADLAMLKTLLDRWAITGEALSGAYLWIADLVVVPQMSVRAIEAAVDGLIVDREISRALSAVPATEG